MIIYLAVFIERLVTDEQVDIGS